VHHLITQIDRHGRSCTYGISIIQYRGTELRHVMGVGKLPFHHCADTASQAGSQCIAIASPTTARANPSITVKERYCLWRAHQLLTNKHCLAGTVDDIAAPIDFAHACIYGTSDLLMPRFAPNQVCQRSKG
jgi:hypothetical protein